MLRFIPLIGIITTTLACVPQDVQISTDSVRGKQLYMQNCVACHGANLTGGGVESLGLGKPPPNLRSLTAQNRGVFPRGFVLDKIYGPLSHKALDTAMPEFGKGDLGPLVQVEEDGLSTPIPADLLALTNYLETQQD